MDAKIGPVGQFSPKNFSPILGFDSIETLTVFASMEDRYGGPSPPPSTLPSSPEIATPSEAGESDEVQVMSEVHLGCPPNHSGPHISHFTIALPPLEPTESRYDDILEDELTIAQQDVRLDEDGDLVLTRRSKKFKDDFVLTVWHNITSSIPSVGLQLWRAELVLADFVLHKMFSSSEFDGIVAVELGAGVGLVGMLLARVAKTVFLTDCGDEVLSNCAKNVCLNSGMFNSKTAVYVRELDWKGSWPPQVVDNSPPGERHAWTLSEVEELQRASLFVAADVIYSDDLTDALFTKLKKMMSESPEKVLFLALEKRYNFSLDDLDVVANGYLRFRSYLRDEGEHGELEYGSLPCFVGKCIDLTQIPQYVREYDRGNDVELWQIKYGGGKINSESPGT
ncbi:unnamed protein product [Ilex paraguariensis]|uniref:Methyltransferase-like protein 22 n=1 Tax=Ilex paraguariensis TaxID=185542 RepID=A0ABC8UX53_9AQUA